MALIGKSAIIALAFLLLSTQSEGAQLDWLKDRKAPDVVDLCKEDPDVCAARFDWSGLSGTDETVDLCRIDPDACDVAFKAALQRNFQPAPLCQLDPCACQKCDGVFQHAFNGQESAGNPNLNFEIRPAVKTQLIGADLMGSSPFPSFEGKFRDNLSESSKKPAEVTFGIGLDDIVKETAFDQRVGATCNASESRPLEYWRELLLRRNEIKACSDAASLMLDQRSRYNADYVSIITLKASKENERSAFRIFDDYKDACIHPVDGLPQSKAIEALLGRSFRKNMTANIGELNFDGANVHCTASIARRNNSKIGLVTAAHCIGEVTRGAGDGRLQYAQVYPSMTFTTFDGQAYGVQINDDLVGYDYSELDDTVFIPLLQTSTKLTLEGFPIGTAPALWTPLYIVGVNPFLGALANAENKGGAISLLTSSSLSLEPGCRVYGIDGRQLLHNCQTEQGMSGSPIFVATDSGAQLVAVHTGENPILQRNSCPDSRAKAANLGVLINP